MSNLPPLTDHAFWRNLRVQCNTDKPLSRIAAELGVDVDDLGKWIMDYKGPRKAKPYVNRDSAPIFDLGSMAADPGTNARRFANWRKAQAGAAATRRMLEVAGK